MQKSGRRTECGGDIAESSFDLFVAFKAQDNPSSGPHQASGAVEEFEPQGPGRLQRPSGGALQGAVALPQSGFDLEVGQEVVGDQDELLPGAVGLVVLRGDGIEGQVALEFSYGLLVQSPPAHEAPQGAGAQGQVGGHRAVFEGAVVGVEEVELVVLSGRVHDLLAIDHHPEGALPFLYGDSGGEGVYALLHPLPQALSGDLSLEVQPLPEGDFDGIARLVFVQHFKHAVVEEGAVHAQAQSVATPERVFDLCEDGPEKINRRGAVVDVAGPVVQSEEVTAVGQIGRDREVTGDLAAMGVVSAPCAFRPVDKTVPSTSTVRVRARSSPTPRATTSALSRLSASCEQAVNPLRKRLRL